MEAARRGEPASSKPKPDQTTTEKKSEEPEVVKPKETKSHDKVAEPANAAKGENDLKKADGPEPTADEESDIDSVKAEPPPAVLIINSSTHRKEHARLGRRMAAADAAVACPEMYRLWNGSRKDKFCRNHETLNICFCKI